MESRASPRPGGLSYCVAFSQLLGLTVVAVTGAWLGLYRGGIAWESALQFNVHPLCMVIGLVFLQGDALLVYRVFRNEAKRTTKILHGLLHGFAFIIALVGLVAVFAYHRKKGYADLYSLHSWCGILAFVLYVVQWLVGFSFFLFPGASFSLRSRYRPLHIFFGASIFLLSVGTALLGLKEALLFKLGKTSNNLKEHSRPEDCRELAVGETRAPECTGAGYLENTGLECKDKGSITLFLKFLEENEQEHLIFVNKKKKKRKTFTQPTRTSVKAIVSWKKLTSVSDLPGLKHTAQQSPRWHLKRGREHVAGHSKRN
uniref:Transmembrane ascorbate-dependent reductase CYB561 n=1 Tax=Myotis myotis TaxID=51298 RepID=A0A7J7T400_MYOMY|nr:cytochrome b561 [Myotis myotis]